MQLVLDTSFSMGSKFNRAPALYKMYHHLINTFWLHEIEILAITDYCSHLETQKLLCTSFIYSFTCYTWDIFSVSE